VTFIRVDNQLRENASAALAAAAEQVIGSAAKEDQLVTTQGA
jgi:hypothetical protein